VLSPEAVQSVIDTLARILTLVQGSSSSEGSIEKDLQDAVNNLDSSERQRLDDIVNELTQRSITRFLERLSSVERS
jgi:FixJ family two-component response regulator